jgi:sugar (pentulose or hexulose) kinase
MYPPHLDNVIFHQIRQHPGIQEWQMDRLWMQLSRCVSNKYAESNVGVTNDADIQAHA